MPDDGLQTHHTLHIFKYLHVSRAEKFQKKILKTIHADKFWRSLIWIWQFYVFSPLKRDWERTASPSIFSASSRVGFCSQWMNIRVLDGIQNAINPASLWVAYTSAFTPDAVPGLDRAIPHAAPRGLIRCLCYYQRLKNTDIQLAEEYFVIHFRGQYYLNSDLAFHGTRMICTYV